MVVVQCKQRGNANSNIRYCNPFLLVSLPLKLSQVNLFIMKYAVPYQPQIMLSVISVPQTHDFQTRIGNVLRKSALFAVSISIEFRKRPLSRVASAFNMVINVADSWLFVRPQGVRTWVLQKLIAVRNGQILSSIVHGSKCAFRHSMWFLRVIGGDRFGDALRAIFRSQQWYMIHNTLPNVWFVCSPGAYSISNGRWFSELGLYAS